MSSDPHVWWLCACLVACGGSADGPDGVGDTSEPRPPEEPKTFPMQLGRNRAAPVVRPGDFDEAATYPAIVMLHSYSVTAAVEDLVFQLRPRVDSGQFLLVLPEGKIDAFGMPYWNATPECCDFNDTGVDDEGYLRRIVEELRATYRVSTVAFVGHSNGGFMAYRMACNAPEAVDRLMVLAGSGPLEETACASDKAIPLLHVHGTADDTIDYEPNDGAGGMVPTVGAVETVRRYADRMGCEAATTELGPANLQGGVPGKEATGALHVGCRAPVSLWTVEGGEHTFATASEVLRDGIVAFATGAAPSLPDAAAP